jgi:hypothetical protein
MIHWLKRLFTDKDGDADEMAVLVVAAVAVMLFCELYSVLYVKDFKFNPQEFGIGVGGLIGIAAGAIGYKSSKEANP